MFHVTWPFLDKIFIKVLPFLIYLLIYGDVKVKNHVKYI